MNLEYIFSFGSLVDAMVTQQPELMNKNELYLVDEASGELNYFTESDWKRAELMAECALDEPAVKLILKNAHFQHVFLRREFEYKHVGQVVKMPTRCKFDVINKLARIGCDIKTTGCKTQQSFVESINHFKYHRQGALYMDCAQIDRMWYIGIGKTPMKNGRHPIFKFAIERGDDTYLKGYYQYNRLGYLYKHMVYDLDIQLNIAA